MALTIPDRHKCPMAGTGVGVPIGCPSVITPPDVSTTCEPANRLIIVTVVLNYLFVRAFLLLYIQSAYANTNVKYYTHIQHT